MAGTEYTVTLRDGGPWGFRLQGGKDFGVPLTIARITPGSKADLQGILQGDYIEQINSQHTENLLHLDAQNLIKASKDSLRLRLVRKAGNIRSMASKSPIVITDTVHSGRVDHKFNARPKPFGSPAVPVGKPAKDTDDYDDSEVLKMLKNSSISRDSGLASSSRSSDDFDGSSFDSTDDYSCRANVQSRFFQRLQQHLTNTEDDLPPPPPEAFGTLDEDEGYTAGQSRSFKLLQRSVDSGDSPGSVLSGDYQTSNPPPPRQYTINSSVRTGKPQPLNTKEPPPCPPGVKPMQVLPSEVNFTRPSDAARAAHAERRQGNAPPVANQLPPSHAYSRPSPTAPPATTTPPTSKPKSAAPPANDNQVPHCHGCGQTIHGSFLSALGRNWHPEHFNCAGCRKSLQNKGFVEESSNLYCESCYDMKFAPHCDVCNEAIVGPCVKAIGKMFHPEHFICDHCGKQIANESFHLDSGKPYCAQDYKELFCVKCCQCKQVIGGGDRWLEALDKPWHADCFRCAVCGQNLENTGFYSLGSQAVCPEHA